MIFGNWRPAGIAAGAGLFGFADALQLRSAANVHALLLFVAFILGGLAVIALVRARVVRAVFIAAVGAAFLIWYWTNDEVPREFVGFTPHLVTLIVLASASQRLRPPGGGGPPVPEGPGVVTTRRDDFERDGYLVVEDFVPASVCAALRDRANELVDGFDPAEAVSIFSTHEQTRTSDDYFLGSGDTVRFFFEEDAFADDGSLRQAKSLSINKIGHALHDLDPVFAPFSHSAEIAAVAKEIGLDDPVVVQSMYIFKQPRIGGEVTMHTDHTFLWTDPPSVTGFWFAIEDATLENGCMWALPGGHRLPVRKRFKRAAGGGTEFEVFDPEPYPLDGEVPLPAAAGTLVVLDGRLPHRSGPNHSDRVAARVHPPRHRSGRGVARGQLAAPVSAIDWDALYAAAREAGRRTRTRRTRSSPWGAPRSVDDGRIVSGCNVENASFGLTLCAECGVVSALHASGGGRLVAVACVGPIGDPLTSCGRCRQLLFEAGGADLLVNGRPLSELLPDAFGPAHLP